MEIQTLEQFMQDLNSVDGHYAVWKSGMIPSPTDNNWFYGFSGGIAKFTIKSGFEDYPEWMDETDESEIKIILLEELPSIAELSGH